MDLAFKILDFKSWILFRLFISYSTEKNRKSKYLPNYPQKKQFRLPCLASPLGWSIAQYASHPDPTATQLQSKRINPLRLTYPSRNRIERNWHAVLIINGRY